jgi:drug/metabolite transporter (DMT)-like permease
VVLLFGCLSWAVGSIVSRTLPLPQSASLATGLQMSFGGLFLGVLALLRGELAGFRLASVGSDAVWSLLYLTVFGSVIGYGCYCWLLRVVPVSLVSTHSYVNPMVALALGWALLGEPLTTRTLVAGVLTLAGVVLISWASAGERIPAPGPAISGVPNRSLIQEPLPNDIVFDTLLEPGESFVEGLFDTLEGQTVGVVAR